MTKADCFYIPCYLEKVKVLECHNLDGAEEAKAAFPSADKSWIDELLKTKKHYDMGPIVFIRGRVLESNRVSCTEREEKIRNGIVDKQEELEEPHLKDQIDLYKNMWATEFPERTNTVQEYQQHNDISSTLECVSLQVGEHIEIFNTKDCCDTGDFFSCDMEASFILDIPSFLKTKKE